MSCSISTSVVVGFTMFLVAWPTMLWVGISMLVPQHPFHHRDIPTGVCLIVFSMFIGVFGGIITFSITFGCCWCVEKCFHVCEDNCCV